MARGPDKKQRKKRSDAGKKRTGPVGAVKNEVNRRKRRAEVRERKEELELKELEAREQARQTKKKVGRIKAGATVAGLAGSAVALGTKRGRKAARKAGMAGLRAAGRGTVAVGKAAGRAAKDTAVDLGKAAGRAAREGFDEATTAAKTAAKEKVQSTKRATQEAVRVKAATDKAKVVDAGRRIREKGKQDVDRVKNLFKRRKKQRSKSSDYYLAPVTIEFAAKRSKKKTTKKIRVKGFKRKDGTIVRPSTRTVVKKQLEKKTPGERIGDIGKGLIPVAAAAATAAQAVSTLSDTQLRRRQVGRELSAIGEARKFLGVAGSAGSGFKSVSAGVDSLRNSRTRLGLENKKLELFERDLNQRDLNRVLRAEELKLKKKRKKRKKN